MDCGFPYYHKYICWFVLLFSPTRPIGPKMFFNTNLLIIPASFSYFVITVITFLPVLIPRSTVSFNLLMNCRKIKFAKQVHLHFLGTAFFFFSLESLPVFFKARSLLLNKPIFSTSCRSSFRNYCVLYIAGKNENVLSLFSWTLQE